MVGVARTIASYLLYLFCLFFLPYWLAFTLSYITILFLSMFANGALVFATRITPRRVIRYSLIYCTNYALGMAVLTLLIEILGASAAVAPFFVIAVMFPLNFLMERYALTS